MNIYENNFEHLLDELHRVDLMVRLSLLKKGADHQKSEYFQGLYISEEEVNTILQTLPNELNSNVGTESELEKIDIFTKKINSKKIESTKQGKELRLHILSEIFHLQPFEADALLICLAPELDLRYEKLYSYLQNDVTKKRPIVDHVINLLCYSIEEKFRAREYFSPGAPLIKSRLIHLAGDGTDDQHTLLSKSIKVDERIISYLLGSNEIDSRIRNFSTIVEPKKSFNELILPDEDKNTLIDQIKWTSDTNVPLMLLFHGPYGTGKKMTGEAVCRELGTSLLIVDSKALMTGESHKLLSLILREALLQNSSLYFEGFDALMKEENLKNSVSGIIQEIDRFTNMIFLSSETPWEPPALLKNHRFVSCNFLLPSFVIRKKLWESFLNDRTNISAMEISVLASKFKISGGQIRDSLFTAWNIATTKKPGTHDLSIECLYAGCKAQSNQKLTSFAKKIEPHHSWEDIVLPEDTKEQLKEVGGYIKHKEIVYADWGFDKKLSMGKGLNVLFSGPSGTGKTMAAGIIAGEARLELYKTDLSGLVSKYIGETEKNLQKIFKEAETSNAILFFDEADALFGKRSEIRDSHDRYANIEINYLLQKMEEYTGIVILASNFKKNIDEAFLRRMHFAIEFPLPDEKSREKIWRNIFPKETPVADDIDFVFLSKFKITGGNIKNIALSAAFLAAGDSRTIKIEHIIRATKREFQKMGKLCTSGDFGKYYELVK
ncbi:MAG: AAA family ATPase [Candidatus Methanoperedens sp.]|nr:AAA family ATPase [Candidatus Methanoperedens sp.]